MPLELEELKILDWAHYTTIKDPSEIPADGYLFKIGQGQKIDSTFLSNIAFAKKAGKPYGGYWFLDPRFDPILQADLCCKTILAATQDPILLVVDVEELILKEAKDEWDAMSKDDQASFVFKFFWRIQLYYLGLPFFYMGQNFYRIHFKGVDFSAWPLMVPDYSKTATQPRLPDCWSHFVIWQKRGDDQEPGLIGFADRSVFYGSRAELEKYFCRPV